MKNKFNTLKSALVIGLISLGSFNTQAQEGALGTPAPEAPAAEAPKTVFAGSADMYYKYDFANPTQANAKANGEYTSFTSGHNSFQLGMASINVSHKMGKASVFADLGFGARAAEFSYNDKSPAATFLIKQLNFTYELTDEFKVIGGSFATHLGYELVDAIANKNYSMSYAFTNGPFFNTGVKVQYTNKSGFGAMVGVSNPTDFKTALESGSNNKTVIGQLSYVKDSGSAYLNFTTGSLNPDTTNRTQFDFVGSKKINDALTLGINATYALVTVDGESEDANWFSGIVYATYAFNSKLTLAYRSEYFSDKKSATPTSFATAGYTAAQAIGGFEGANILANTLSLNYKHGNLTFIPEIRVDSASEKIFLDSKPEPTKLNAYLLFGTTYSF